MYTELIREQKQSNYIVNSDSDIFINTDFSFNKYFTSKAQFQDFYQQSNKKKILWLHLWTLPLQMLCSVCTYPCKTTVQQVTSCMDVWQRQGRTAACTESESYEPQSGNAAGCASDTDVQGTLDKDFSTSLAWRKLVPAPLLYISFSSYILPPICYSAGQARRVWICNRSYWTSVLQNKRTRKETLKKMPNYISTWISSLIRSRNNPYFFPSTAFKFKAQTPSMLPEKPRHKVYPLIWGFVIWLGRR